MHCITPWCYKLDLSERLTTAEARCSPCCAFFLSPAHPAGTSLGDPIEVGAALAVYSEATRRQPLALAASKSWVGHGEPAAGLAGLLFAHAAAAGRFVPPLMHLRAPNPYVASALEQHEGGKAAAPAAALLPKQGGAMPLADAQLECSWGVSAFAFQGTNAHAVVEAALPSAPAHDNQLPQLPVWQHKRQHVLPEAHLLIAAAAVTGQRGSAATLRRAVFHAELAAASLAFMWDHTVLGKALFPGGCRGAGWGAAAKPWLCTLLGC